MPPQKFHPLFRDGRLFSASALLGGMTMLCAVASAEVATNPQQPAVKAAPKVMKPDSNVMTQLSTFLREYHRALSAGDREYLAEHTHFPLPFAEGVLDMEAKVKTSTLASIDELLKVRRRLRWPSALVPKGPEHLSTLRRGREKCDDAKSPDVPDWKQGEPAIEVAGDEATLTYLASPCESETHIVTLKFRRSDKRWRLSERAVRMGTK